MNYDLVFVTQLLLAVGVSLSLLVVRSRERAAHFVALCLARTGVVAAGAVLVVVTVPVLSATGPGYEGESGGAFATALALVALSLACERYVAVQERLALVADLREQA